MDGKIRRMPLSISLQDLSTYRTASAPADLITADCEAYDFGTARGGILHRPPKGSSSRGQVLGNRFLLRGAAVAALVLLVLIVIYFGFLWGRTLWDHEDPMRFAIVMDCGSTGTRVYVYGWIHNEKSIPVMYRPPARNNDNLQVGNNSNQRKAYNRMETEPGFHQLLHNETGLRSAVQPLLDWAKQQIPLRSHAETPLFLLGTAGLRRLPTADSEWLLDKAWSIIEKSPFMCRRTWVRIITGVEEAYYGWVALNYIVDRLGDSRQTTVGSLDLGGSSLEVTFEPAETPKSEHSVNLSIGSVEHHLYAFSHAGFGLNDAFDKSVATLLNNGENISVKGGMLEVRHPCLHSDYQQPYSCSSYCVAPPSLRSRIPADDDSSSSGTSTSNSVEMKLVGVPNWERCQALARSVVTASGLLTQQRHLDCEQPHCALGKYQPQARGQFYAVAGFFVMYKFFGLSSTASLDDLLQRGQQFCEKPWPVARQSVQPQPSIDRYCFRTPYVVALIREGLHIQDEQITVGPGDITWTQGAALLEAVALTQQHPLSRRWHRKWFGSPSTTPMFEPTLSMIVLIVAVLLMIAAISCRRIDKFLRQTIADPSKPTTLSSSSSSATSFYSSSYSSSAWLPLPMRSLGIRTLRSVDFRTKLPQSPAPVNSNEVGGGGGSGGGEVHVALLDSDALRLPPPGPRGVGASKMQLKGGSRLQSRRTPSKEDLNTYEFDR